ncbi:sensor histidine kinase [Aliarcobacter cryaerophilus]|uniref:histidine kinase n=1 Tax=Aliarcobacter cryaerophilus TaxID=28198 RepID=A0A2S9TNZ0_9BACT|nr:sensor histidine kinase [Aliarcobacter cryaerophilus]PRN00562.1 hypothetical protein CJ668_04880 [Arcobacter cryaerophilus gv. pseudocryaerophilus]
MIRIILFLLIIFSNIFSDIIDISDLDSANITNNIYFINDKDKIYSYEDINSKVDLEQLKIMHIGAAKGPLWTKLKLVNNSNNIENITLYNPLSGINKIDVYVIKENNLLNTFYLGDLRNQEKRESLSTYSNINLTLNPNDEITIISKIENFYVYNIGWNILKTSEYFKMDSNKIFFAGLLGGIVLLFCIYNIINFILYKNKSYLIICFIALSLGLYQYGFHGIIYFLDININLELITAITWNAPAFGGIFLLLFVYYFFEQKIKYKKASYTTIFFIICYIVLILLTIYAQFFNEDYFKYTQFIAIVILVTTLYLFLFGLYALLKKETGAVYYFIGEGTLFIVIFFHTLGLFNVIPYENILKFSIPFAYMLDLLSLVIALYIKNKKEQEVLRKSQLMLMEQSRFNSMGQAIGHVSHQWKTPLTSVGTSLTLLEAIYNHDSKRLIETFEKHLPLMKKSINLMKKSIDEFSTFYQTKFEKEDFLLLETISNIIEILRSKIILKKVTINYEIEENFKLYSYEHIISNIFLVLINNSLEAFKTEDNNYIKICVKNTNQKLVIVYEDNAGGIKIKPIESIFEYFVSSKQNSKSSGIGLAVVKLLINEKLNGVISVKNIGEGALFKITI